MTRYLISFNEGAMDHIPDEDVPDVGKAAHAVVQEAADAGVWVFGGGLQRQVASVVETSGLRYSLAPGRCSLTTDGR